MPRLTVWFVRMALVHLALGFTLGALLLINKGVPFSPAIWHWRPAHIEFLLVGWVVQLVLGVAFWILPRFQQRRGNVSMAWAAFGLLNLGVWLIAVVTPLGLPASWLVIGRLVEIAAALAFALNAWPRVKPIAVS